MAIKIIKPGQTEFNGFCDRCGCWFTYELSDLTLTGTVDCPTCKKTYYHPARATDTNKQGGTLGYLNWPPEPIPCTTKTDPCAGCTWKERLERDGIYVGDTPCQWCQHNKFNSTTAVSTLEQYINPDCKSFSASDCAISSASNITGTYATSCVDKESENVSGSCATSEVDAKLQNLRDMESITLTNVSEDSVRKILEACTEVAHASVDSEPQITFDVNCEADSKRPPAPPTSGSNAVKACNSFYKRHRCGGNGNCKDCN